jgi:hypothetical protein
MEHVIVVLTRAFYRSGEGRGGGPMSQDPVAAVGLHCFSYQKMKGGRRTGWAASGEGRKRSGDACSRAQRGRLEGAARRRHGGPVRS